MTDKLTPLTDWERLMIATGEPVRDVTGPGPDEDTERRDNRTPGRIIGMFYAVRRLRNADQPAADVLAVEATQYLINTGTRP